jgi:hypothetical protein
VGVVRVGLGFFYRGVKIKDITQGFWGFLRDVLDLVYTSLAIYNQSDHIILLTLLFSKSLFPFLLVKLFTNKYCSFKKSYAFNNLQSSLIDSILGFPHLMKGVKNHS